jgi:hypothetical protein
MLEYSALLFIIPAIYAWYKNNIDYGNAFIFLTITSYIWHSKTVKEKLKTPNFWWIDQFGVYNIVLIGSYHYFYQFNNMMILFKILIPLFFLSCIIIYIYNDDIINDEILHFYIHFITFICHNMIIFNI